MSLPCSVWVEPTMHSIAFQKSSIILLTAFASDSKSDAHPGHRSVLVEQQLRRGSVRGRSEMLASNLQLHYHSLELTRFLRCSVVLIRWVVGTHRSLEQNTHFLIWGRCQGSTPHHWVPFFWPNVFNTTWSTNMRKFNSIKFFQLFILKLAKNGNSVM